MKIRERAGRWQNRVILIIWIVVLTLLMFFKSAQLRDTYEGVSGSDRIDYCVKYLQIEWVLTLLAAIIWWLSATKLKNGWRRFVETHSFLCSLFFIGVVWAIALIIYFSFDVQILTYGGGPKRIYYIFALPAAFLALMYVLPPTNLNRVIAPPCQKLVSRLILKAVGICILLAAFVIIL